MDSLFDNAHYGIMPLVAHHRHDASPARRHPLGTIIAIYLRRSLPTICGRS